VRPSAQSATPRAPNRGQRCHSVGAALGVRDTNAGALAAAQRRAQPDAEVGINGAQDRQRAAACHTGIGSDRGHHDDDKRIVNCFGEARESRSLGPRRQGIDRDRLLDEGRRNNKAPYLRQPPRAGRVCFRRCPDRAAADRRMPRAPARLSADDVVARRQFCAIFLFAWLVISVPWAAPRWH
jgi:hypothetical protein